MLTQIESDGLLDFIRVDMGRQMGNEGTGEPLAVDRGFAGTVMASDHHQQAPVLVGELMQACLQSFQKAFNRTQLAPFRDFRPAPNPAKAPASAVTAWVARSPSSRRLSAVLAESAW